MFFHTFFVSSDVVKADINTQVDITYGGSYTCTLDRVATSINSPIQNYGSVYQHYITYETFRFKYVGDYTVTYYVTTGTSQSIYTKNYTTGIYDTDGFVDIETLSDSSTIGNGGSTQFKLIITNASYVTVFLLANYPYNTGTGGYPYYIVHTSANLAVTSYHHDYAVNSQSSGGSCSCPDYTTLFNTMISNQTLILTELGEIKTNSANAVTLLTSIDSTVTNIYNVISNGTSSSSTAAGNLNSGSDNVSSAAGNFVSAEDDLIDDFSSDMSNIDLSSHVIGTSNIVTSASWFKAQLDNIFTAAGVDLQIVWTLPLILALAMFLIGRGAKVLSSSDRSAARGDD